MWNIYISYVHAYIYMGQYIHMHFLPLFPERTWKQGHLKYVNEVIPWNKNKYILLFLINI